MEETISIVVIGLVFAFFIYRLYVLRSGDIEVDCDAGQCASSLYDLSTQCPGTDIDTVQEVCHSSGLCDNARIPCTLTQASSGSICPGNPLYTGQRQNGVCTNRLVCPDFARVYFEKVGDVYVQRLRWISPKQLDQWSNEDEAIQAGAFTESSRFFCGLSDANLQYVWPRTCIEGEFQSVSGVWYCVSSQE